MPKTGFLKRKIKLNLPPFPYILLSILVFISLIGLDYVSWKKGKISHIFSLISGNINLVSKTENLNKIVEDNLKTLGITADSIHQFRDNKRIFHLMINVSSEDYIHLNLALEKSFQEEHVSIFKEENRYNKKDYHLWQISSEGKHVFYILFSSQIETLEPRKKPNTNKNKAAIIIDDVGYSLSVIEDICSLMQPLTVSILPSSLFAKEIAYIAHQNNLEIILHLPLESVNDNIKTKFLNNIIHSQMTKKEINKNMEIFLDQVPFIKGVNNHKGSDITTNENLMQTILEPLKKRNLFFIDSRTTQFSTAYDTAQKLNVPSAYRNVFIDGKLNEDYIRSKLLELFQIAQETGKAVGICHPKEETLKALKKYLPLMIKYNVELVFVSQIVH